MKLYGIAMGILLPISLFSQANLNVSSGADINVSENWVLTVEGPITNNGNVTIESGSSLIQTHSGTDANINSGTYFVKRIGSNSASSYNIWSSPIMAASILGTGSVYNGTNACDIYAFNGSTQEWKYDYTVNSSGDCDGNAVVFSSNYLLTDVTPDNIMDPTRGYFVPGDGTPERIFTGDVNNGAITTTIYSTNITTTQWSGTNWNLVGNPFPSAIDLADFWTLNTSIISDGIYLWNDPNTGTYNQCSDYLVWNPIGVAASCGASSTTLSSGVLSSGQGFWVYAANTTPGTATLTFDNSLRTVASNSVFYKTTPTFERVWLSVSRNNRVTNQILLGLKDDATVGYDPQYDARKLPESSPFELAFVQDTGIYLILAQPTLSYPEQDELPLYLNTDSAGIHEFAFDSMQNVNGGNKYYLIDKKLNITHDLSSPYQVQLAAGEYQNRFYLLYTDVVNGTDESANTNNFVKVFQSSTEIQVQSSKVDLKKVMVYNAVGAQIWHQNKVNSPSLSIPVHQLAAGVYFINYELTNGESETKKLIITN